MPTKPNVALPGLLAAALLFAVPAGAQTAPTPSGVTSTTPAAAGNDVTTPPATPPVLESPALGPLAGRDTPLVPRPYTGGTLPGFPTSGYGVIGTGVPLEFGNRSYAFRPSIGVELLATNNVYQSSQNPSGDIVTTISPSIEAAVATSRLVGSLQYSPALRLYANNTSNSGIDQFGAGRLLAAVIPSLFFVDMRGAASVQQAFPGQIPGSGQFAAGSQNMQTYTAQVTPFLVHRFGSAASSQLGYSFQYAEQGWADFGNNGAGGSPSNFLAHRGFAILRSGEDFGRMALQARIDGTRYAGSGIYENAHRFVTALSMRYALRHSVALLGEIGYQNEAFSGTNPISIRDAIWSVGLRLIPNPDSIVIVRYGHHDGYNSLSLNAGVAIGVRTDLFATYRDSLGTSLTETQDLLSTTTTDALGNPIDVQTGGPVILVNSFLGLTDTLYRMRIGTATLSHHWQRDAFALSATWQQQIPFTSAIGSNNSNVTTTTGAYASFSWSHAFSPRTTGIATVQYGSVYEGQGAGPTFTVAGALTHRLSDTVNAGMQVAWSGNSIGGNYSQSGQGYSQFVIRVGLRKSF